jgi:ABC-type uncharacterized transport system permease subunit
MRGFFIFAAILFFLVADSNAEAVTATVAPQLASPGKVFGDVFRSFWWFILPAFGVAVLCRMLIGKSQRRRR